ncbi:MAG TPA: DUF6717 family protein, partial [Fimbriimonas sp.]|nr:DUF6717 family protein [Fimbriimonas sp.]
VGGADTVIDQWVKSIPNAEVGFRLIFSHEPFPGFQYMMSWVRPEMSGNVYRCEELGMEGWLCPALLKYFEKAPPKIYAKCEAAG